MNICNNYETYAKLANSDFCTHFLIVCLPPLHLLVYMYVCLLVYVRQIEMKHKYYVYVDAILVGNAKVRAA